MTEAELIEIERRANAASSFCRDTFVVNPGDSKPGVIHLFDREEDDPPLASFSGPNAEADTEFICTAKRDIAALLAEVRHLRGALAADAHRLEAAAMRVGIIAGCDAPDEMADLIEFLRASRTWQPIETAPKDGTWVIIGGRGWRNRGFYVDDPEKHCCEETGWYTLHDEVLYRYALEPTHWMPLPEPPENVHQD